MPYAGAERRHVLCETMYDSVLALGGSASYLTRDEIEQLRSRAKRDVLLMHYTPGAAQTAPGLDPRPLRVAATSATSQTRIGRHIASILPGKQTPCRKPTAD